MELLPDPLNDRVINHFKPPPHLPITKSLLFPPQLKGSPDW